MKNNNVSNELKLAALKAFLIDSEEATREEIEHETVTSTYNEDYDTFEIIGNEYKVLTDEEATEAAKDEILSSLWAFNAKFILQHTEFYETSNQREDAAFIKSLQELQSSLCESATPLIKALIKDIDEFIIDALDADGRGHFIAYYDLEENEMNDYFIYRTN